MLLQYGSCSIKTNIPLLLTIQRERMYRKFKNNWVNVVA
jgi:hypothetical protein